MTLLPIAAWMATSNIWRGMSSFSFSASARPRVRRLSAVDDDRERVDRLAVDEDVELDQVGLPIVRRARSRARRSRG